MPFIRLINVWFGFEPGNPVLRGVSLEARGGERVAVVGPTGSGKTTLLLVAAGLLKPERGDVLLDGRSIWEQLPQARRRIGLLFQDPDDQLFNPTVYDEIAYALRSLGLPDGEVEKRVRRVAVSLGIEGLLPRSPYRLSVGQKKLVALASILVYEPDILLLDEPTANLDAASVEKVKKTILDASSQGKLVLFATHDVDLVLELSTRLCVLEGGALSCMCTREAVESGALEKTSLPKPLTLKLLLETIGGWRSLAGVLEKYWRRQGC